MSGSVAYVAKRFKKKLVHSIVVAIVAQNNFVIMLNSFITNVLKCKACLKAKFKCASVTMHSLVMSPFSCDFIIIDKLKDHQCLAHTAPSFYMVKLVCV